MKMKWLLVAGSISCLGACPSTTVGEGEGDVVAGEGEGDAAEGEGDGSAEGEGDVGEGEGEGDAGEGEGDSGEGEGEGEGEPPLCADPLHNGGDGSCVPLRECSGGFAIYEATDSCSAWKKAPEFAFNEFLNTTLFVHQNDIYFSTGDEAGGHLFRTRLQDGTLTPYVDVTLPA